MKSMKNHRVLTEKAVNAKVVFRGVIVEIKKISDQEVELTFPETVDTKELLSYLESFGVLKRKVVVPHAELQPPVQVEENTQVDQEVQVKEDNAEDLEKEVKREDSSEAKITQTEEPSQVEGATTTKKRTRKPKGN
jgi:hypothetical protein